MAEFRKNLLNAMAQVFPLLSAKGTSAKIPFWKPPFCITPSLRAPLKHASAKTLATPDLQRPDLLQESLGPKCPGSVFRGVCGALRALGSGVSKKCPESVPGVSGTPF